MGDETRNSAGEEKLAQVAKGKSQLPTQKDSVGFDNIHRADELLVEFLNVPEETAYPTGIKSLDGWLMGGLRTKRIYTMAARPGEGKTSIALTIARRMAIDAGVPTIFLSLEMSKHEIVERMVCQATLTPSEHLWEHRKQNTLVQKTSFLLQLLKQSWFHIEDDRGATIPELETLMAEMEDSPVKPKLIVIDHLQQIQMPFGVSRADAINTYMADLKRFAKQKDVAIILCCQINRQGKEKPSLIHLKGSGGIEECSDVVMIGARSNYDDSLTKEDTSADCDYDLWIAKHRQGATYKLSLTFRPPCFEFLEPTAYGAPSHPSFETRVIKDNTWGTDRATGEVVV